MRTATYDEILRFLRIDGWVPVRTTGHVHYEKRLPSGETLRAHASVKQPLAATFAPNARAAEVPEPGPHDDRR